MRASKQRLRFRFYNRIGEIIYLMIEILNTLQEKADQKASQYWAEDWVDFIPETSPTLPAPIPKPFPNLEGILDEDFLQN